MPKIDQMYAFIIEDTGPDDEGVIAFESKSETTGESVWLPLVGADMARINSLRPLAKGIGKQIDHKVMLVRFTNRENLEVL